MAIITFTLTAREFIAGQKSVTRRAWKKRHWQRWQGWWDAGRLEHEAWDRLPISGGKRIGRFRLTCRPYREKLAEMPESDLAAEGGMCASLAEFCHLIGKTPADEVTVIRFVKLPD